MPTYRYQPGDRPLEGFTVRAPAGRGGFGEVYFAESDAGREVALKALFVQQGHDEIELRGIRHCMNLKSPHLVSIFDVKNGHDDTPFVVMEYVAGPSLRDLLNDAPAGLGPDKAAFFLREVAKGLSHLHGYGVVHRDLKPANIFYEDGYVKIGDYGLSKLMSADAQASQTITVGTVHYMAPEIGAGKYDKSIDLYALGCLLYEMLTGKVPYAGASPSEVLMKHLQAEPDLRDVPEHFARVIKKALQKDPDQRYATAAEMVEDLFGADHVRNSVSQLNAAELSTYAARVGRRVDAAPTPMPTPTPTGRRNVTWVSTTNAKRDRLEPLPVQWPNQPQRLFIGCAVLISLLATLPLQWSTAIDVPSDTSIVAVVFLLMLGLPAGWALAQDRTSSRSGGYRARAAALIPFLLVSVLTIPATFAFIAALAPNGSVKPHGFLAVVAFAWLMLLGTPWFRYTRPDRERPFSLKLWLGHGVATAVLAIGFLGSLASVAFALPLIAAIGAQLLSPVYPPHPHAETAPHAAEGNT